MKISTEDLGFMGLTFIDLQLGSAYNYTDMHTHVKHN